MESIPVLLDPYLIALYKTTGYVVIDYFIGTLMVSFITVVVGEFTLSLTLRLNRRHIEGMEAEMREQHNLSMAALDWKDRKSYKACNDRANDAFGKYFFNMIAYSAACLWPIPFALSWMQTRFLGVEFELAYPISLIWPSTGYVTTFILCYILTRIVFKNVRRYLPYFRGVQKTLDLCARDSGARQGNSVTGAIAEKGRDAESSRVWT